MCGSARGTQPTRPHLAHTHPLSRGRPPRLLHSVRRACALAWGRRDVHVLLARRAERRAALRDANVTCLPSPVYPHRVDASAAPYTNPVQGGRVLGECGNPITTMVLQCKKKGARMGVPVKHTLISFELISGNCCSLSRGGNVNPKPMTPSTSEFLRPE